MGSFSIILFYKLFIMKKIEAIIRKSQFEDVKEALHKADIDFFSYWDVTGIGKETADQIYRATVYETRFIQRRLLSIIVRDQNIDRAVDAILSSARTGELGDGKIFISDIQETIRIRNGERGPEALYIKDAIE
jgi:nitrogen regulatory protein P-II 1